MERRQAQEGTSPSREEACGLGPGAPHRAQRVLRGADLSPSSSCATDHQAWCPRMPLTPFPEPHHGLRPPQGSERWRKTGKPTKTFQIRQACGADKSCAGGMRFQLLPNGADPSKVACGHRKMRHLPLSVGLIVSATPKRAHAGGSHSRGLGLSPWLQVTTWRCPVPSRGLQGFSGNGGMSSLGCW